MSDRRENSGAARRVPQSRDPSAAAGPPSGGRPIASPSHTRISKTWVGLSIGIAILVVVVVFTVQNTQSVAIEFLWFDFSVPLGAALLLALLVGALVMTLVGSARILELRSTLRRVRHARTGGARPPGTVPM